MEAQVIYIRPTVSHTVRRPDAPYSFLPDEPTAVVEHPYWWRKLARGEVILCDAPKTDKKTTKAARPAEE